jgi:hypothetical protein
MRRQQSGTSSNLAVIPQLLPNPSRAMPGRGALRWQEIPGIESGGGPKYFESGGDSVGPDVREDRNQPGFGKDSPEEDGTGHASAWRCGQKHGRALGDHRPSLLKAARSIARRGSQPTLQEASQRQGGV